MRGRFSNLLPLILVALLAGMSYWLDSVMQGPLLTGDKRVTHEPDFTVVKLLATRMGVDGRIRDTLQAARMLHFPDDDSTELEQPKFVSFSQGSPVTVTAKRAQLTSNAGNIYFRDEVRATRARQAGRRELVVATDYMHVLPDDNIARTDRRVTISDGAATIVANGMELNNETRVVKLSGGVRGVFQDGAPVVRDTRPKRE